MRRDVELAHGVEQGVAFPAYLAARLGELVVVFDVAEIDVMLEC